jgi:hypothetical protein
MVPNWDPESIPRGQNRLVPERLAALAVQVEAITRRIRTLGLSRTAEDLHQVSSELRRLGGELMRRDVPDDEATSGPHDTPEPAT